jgi:peptidoglycan/LPS O-acetylase OafA/YrhL
MTVRESAGSDEESVADRSAERVAYQPALDGLRGVAVLLVLVFHGGDLHGGFLGVDLFFVLSGYLITSLLLTEHASTGRIAIGSFWARRARRLLPALLVLLLGVALYSVTIAAPTDLAEIRGDAIATLLYVQNWHLILGNVQLQRGTVLLNHTWSLSVEEQWYLAWPALLALLLAWKRVRPSRVLAVIIGLAAASAIWTYVVSLSGPQWFHVYYGTDTRAQELLGGAALAFVLRYHAADSRRRRVAIEVTGLVGCLVIGAIVLTTTPESRFFSSGGFAIVAVAVAAVIAASVQNSSTVIRPLLSATPLRGLGLISYGVYLYHLPLYFWLSSDRMHISGAAVLIVRVAASIIAATISFFLVERPIRRGALRGAKLRIAAPAALAVVLVATIIATREPTPPLLANDTIATFRRFETAPGRRLLVVGHRLAFELQSVGGTYTRNGWNAVSVGFVDCSFIPGDIYLADLSVFPEAAHCKQLLPALRTLRGTFQPDVAVLMPDSHELYDRRVGSHLLHVGTAAWATDATAHLDAAIEALSGPNRIPVLLTNVPCSGAQGGSSELDATAHDPARNYAINQFIATYAETHRQAVIFADLNSLLCHNGTRIASVDGRLLFDSQGTLTPTGARYLWDWVVGIAARGNALPAHA